MSHIYAREAVVGGSKVPIHWEPSDEAAAKDAVKDVLGSAPDAYPVEVDDPTAEAIRERYAELVSGGS